MVVGSNIIFADRSDEKDNPVIELIHESMSLLNENIKLFLENKRLKEKLKELEGKS